jgi:hypothetical protein
MTERIRWGASRIARVRTLSLRTLSLRTLSFGALALALAAPLAIGCGGPPPEPTHAQVKAGDLPAGADWTGVFYSPIYGHLHLIKEGTSVSGKWRTATGDKWGELHGEATGDLLKFDWVEHKIGLVGPGATSEGRGYFKYVVPEGENTNHEIHGEWGLGRSEVGQKWDAIRQRNQVPDPNSIGPDETENVNLPDEWDSANKTPPPPDQEPEESEGEGESELE